MFIYYCHETLGFIHSNEQLSDNNLIEFEEQEYKNLLDLQSNGHAIDNNFPNPPKAVKI